MPGALYVVATPIGNLEDMTHRAVRVLREVSVVACEDTRHSRRLLDHYEIATPLLSYHEHNEQSRTADLVARLESGAAVALISDAGTPLISDPGYRLVSAAVAAGIQVIPIPGASAILSALSAAGVATDAFYFGGFLPPKSGQRRSALEQAGEMDCTLVFYEAPHRILESLSDIAELFPARRIVLGRELTKLHEEFLRGTAVELREVLAGRGALKGEITVVLEKAAEPPKDDRPLAVALEEHLKNGLSRMEAIKAIARERGLPKRQVYAALEEPD